MPNNEPVLSAVFYDAEIIKCIPGRNEKKDAKFEYCRSWEDFKNMGIAVICAYDTVERMPRIFMKGNFGDFVKLVESRDELIGFNSQQFDDRLLAENQIKCKKTTYDFMVKCKEAAQRDHRLRFNGERGGYALKDLLKDNGLPGKLMKGGDAPKLWQAGLPGQVVDYCMHDVMLLYKLFLRKEKLHVSAVEGHVKMDEVKSLAEAKKRAERDDW